MGQRLHLGELEVDSASPADLCRRYQVGELSLFGSAARGEMRPDSDVDRLVEFLPNADAGLVEHAGPMLELERLIVVGGFDDVIQIQIVTPHRRVVRLQAPMIGFAV